MIKRGFWATVGLLIVQEIFTGIIWSFILSLFTCEPGQNIPNNSNTQTNAFETVETTTTFEPLNEIKSTYSVVESQMTIEELENVFWGMHEGQKAKLEISEVLKSPVGDSLYFNFNIYFVDSKTGRLLSDQGEGIALPYKIQEQNRLLHEVFLVGEYNFFEGEIGRMYDHELGNQYVYLNVAVQSKSMQFEFYNRRYNPILIEENSNSIFDE